MGAIKRQVLIEKVSPVIRLFLTSGLGVVGFDNYVLYLSQSKLVIISGGHRPDLMGYAVRRDRDTGKRELVHSVNIDINHMWPSTQGRIVWLSIPARFRDGIIRVMDELTDMWHPHTGFDVINERFVKTGLEGVIDKNRGGLSITLMQLTDKVMRLQEEIRNQDEEILSLNAQLRYNEFKLKAQ